MTENLTTGIVTIALGVISVATVAVIFSKRSNAPAVIQAGGGALVNNILAAVSPLNAQGTAPNTSYGGGFGSLDFSGGLTGSSMFG